MEVSSAALKEQKISRETEKIASSLVATSAGAFSLNPLVLSTHDDFFHSNEKLSTA